LRASRVEATLKAGHTEERIRFPHRPSETGLKRYEFRVGDSPMFPLSVQVVDGKHEVLVLEDTWRWEFKFLRRVLEEDPSFRFTALLSRGSGSFMQFAAPDRRTQLVGFPQNRAQLTGFDTIVVGDVNPKTGDTQSFFNWNVSMMESDVITSYDQVRNDLFGVVGLATDGRSTATLVRTSSNHAQVGLQ
jgi:hypothetical protein